MEYAGRADEGARFIVAIDEIQRDLDRVFQRLRGLEVDGHAWPDADDAIGNACDSIVDAVASLNDAVNFPDEET